VIENRRDRLTTMLVAPLMSCSARLPVYTILIGAFIPAYSFAGGLVQLQGLTLFALYLIGIVVAALVALYMTATIGAAVVTEEARLRRDFGTAYDDYARAAAPAVRRAFSLERAMRNREYRAAAGLAGGFLLLALKAAFNL
jgi:hypothetical protein